jgi:hypothetical protein
VTKKEKLILMTTAERKTSGRHKTGPTAQCGQAAQCRQAAQCCHAAQFSQATQPVQTSQACQTGPRHQKGRYLVEFFNVAACTTVCSNHWDEWRRLNIVISLQNHFYSCLEINCNFVHAHFLFP